MKFRQFLLRLRSFIRYRLYKRRYLSALREIDCQTRENAAEIERQRNYYERRLETERQKYESMLHASVDRALQAVKLLPISHVTLDAAEKAENILNSNIIEPRDPEKELTGNVLGYVLDAKEAFFEAEAAEGRSDAEIQRLWETKFRDLAIANARDAIR